VNVMYDFGNLGVRETIWTWALRNVFLNVRDGHRPNKVTTGERKFLPKVLLKRNVEVNFLGKTVQVGTP